MQELADHCKVFGFSSDSDEKLLESFEDRSDII